MLSREPKPPINGKLAPPPDPPPVPVREYLQHADLLAARRRRRRRDADPKVQVRAVRDRVRRRKRRREPKRRARLLAALVRGVSPVAAARRVDDDADGVARARQVGEVAEERPDRMLRYSLVRP
jgi:hypothetical protein